MPTVLYATYDEKREQCVYVWNETTYAVVIVFFAALAACTITFCYCKIIKELYFSETICSEGVAGLLSCFLFKLLGFLCAVFHS